MDTMVGPSLRQDLEKLVATGTVDLEAIKRLLEQTEERYASLFEQSRDAMYFSSVTGRFIDFNQAMLDLMGYPREELMALPASAIYHDPADRLRFAEAVAAEGAVRAFEVTLVRKDGRRLTCWLSSSVRLDHKGNVIGYQGLIQDLTELRALQTERDRFFSQSRDLICTVSPDGTFKRVNPAFSEILGLPETAILSGRFFDLLHPEDLPRAQHALAGLGANRSPSASAEGEEEQHASAIGRVNFECRQMAPDGTWRVLEWAFSPDLAGHVWYGIGWDITEQRKLAALERDKQLAERSAAMKADFLANMSHELRTPMNAVLGMAHLLAETRLDPVQLDYVRTLETSSANLLETINNILDYSKLDAGKLALDPQPYEPRRMVEDLMQTFKYTAGQKGITLESRIHDNLPPVLMGDSFRLKQILQNLLSNALKFTDNGGVILHAGLDGDLVRFTVEDTGIGIPLERQAAIFDPFAQASESTSRQYGGTGLGLAIVGRLSALLGGTITLHSAPGEGARFRVALPLQLPDKEAVAMMPSAQPVELPSLGRQRVLLVEDNRVNRMVVRELLRNRWPDLILTEAESAEAAQPLLSNRNFDMVLMDVMLPGMDGRALTRWIRSRIDGPEHRLPILGLTAAASPYEQQACLDSGMNGCLSKPVQPMALYREMANVLGDPKATEARHVADDGPTVDLRYLESLTAENPALREDLLRTMERETPEELTRLHAAAQEERWDEVRAYAHRLKSTLQLLGSASLLARLQRVERDARDRQDTGTLVARLETLDSDIRRALLSARSVTDPNTSM